MTLEVDVELNGLEPSDVRVECVVHRVLGSELTVPVQGFAENRRWQHGLAYIEDEVVLLEVFEPLSTEAASPCRFRLELEPPWSGVLQYEVRAVPQHAHLSLPYELGLMRKI
jgi:hypothetical protein